MNESQRTAEAERVDEMVRRLRAPYPSTPAMRDAAFLIQQQEAQIADLRAQLENWRRP